MKLTYILSLLFILSFTLLFSQENNDSAVLKTILTKYYTSEKVIVKDRLQMLHLYCNKAPNNEEFLAVIESNDLLKNNVLEIKKQLNPQAEESWLNDYNALFNNQNQYLKSKVNTCLSFDEFQKKALAKEDLKLRLLIINKPIYFAKKYCLIRVAIYRTVEHNSGNFILLENNNGTWTVKRRSKQMGNINEAEKFEFDY